MFGWAKRPVGFAALTKATERLDGMLACWVQGLTGRASAMPGFPHPPRTTGRPCSVPIVSCQAGSLPVRCGGAQGKHAAVCAQHHTHARGASQQHLAAGRLRCAAGNGAAGGALATCLQSGRLDKLVADPQVRTCPQTPEPSPPPPTCRSACTPCSAAPSCGASRWPSFPSALWRAARRLRR